jgi:hypothetical protein
MSRLGGMSASLRSTSDRNAALPRIDAMCHKRHSLSQSSISSARTIRDIGTSIPSAFAVVRLITKDPRAPQESWARHWPCKDERVCRACRGTSFAMLERAKRASHIDPPAPSYAIMRRARPYRGENPEPSEDVLGELDHRPGIGEQLGYFTSFPPVPACSVSPKSGSRTQREALIGILICAFWSAGPLCLMRLRVLLPKLGSEPPCHPG